MTLPLRTVDAPEMRAAAAPVQACALTRLAVSHFRSYADAALDIDARPVALIGENGAGKTNLLEAISFLTPGRGLRGGTLSEACRRGADPAAPLRAWAVAATACGPEGAFEIGTGLVAQGENGVGEKRAVRINGAAAPSAAALADIVRVLWLTPVMDRLFIESPGGRRRFFDRIALAFDPGHGARSSAYERAMRERLRLLRDGQGDGNWFDGLEEQMAEHGSAIALCRLETLERLKPELVPRASAFPAAEVTLDGEAETLVDAIGREPARAQMRETLRARRRLDGESGRTSFGPHLSDLGVRHQPKGRDAADCSTGEQKALLVGLVLATARAEAAKANGAAPVLLLDEIAAHLDAERRQALFDEIASLGLQAWMTGTDAELFAPLGARAQAFRVAASTLTPFAF